MDAGPPATAAPTSARAAAAVTAAAPSALATAQAATPTATATAFAAVPAPAASAAPAATAAAQAQAAQLELQRQLADDRRSRLHGEHYGRLVALVQSESAAAAAGRQRVHALWRERLRTLKRSELAARVEELVQDFDHHADRKDAAVALLARYVSIAEEQRRRTVRTHLATVDHLLALLQERSALFAEDLEDTLARLQAQYDQEMAVLRAAFDARERVLAEVRGAAADQQDGLARTLRADYAARLGEQRNQSTELCNILRLNLEDANTELERHLLEAHERYRNATESKNHQFKILLLKDQQSAQAIERQRRRVDQLQALIAHWRNKIASTAEEYRAKNALLRQEKDLTYAEFADLKARLQRFRAAERGRMRALVAAAHDAEDRVVGLREQADRIIRQAVLAGRHETEAERVGEVERLDARTRALVDDEARRQAAAAEGLDATGATGIAGAAGATDVAGAAPGFLGAASMAAVAELGPVYRKLSRASLDRLALERESVLLERENRDLRDALQRFLSTSGMGGASATAAAAARP